MAASDSRWVVCRHPWLLGEWSLRHPLRHGYVYALSERSNQPIAFARIELAQQRANEMNEPSRAKETIR
jgi:hypothetical protein